MSNIFNYNDRLTGITIIEFYNDSFNKSLHGKLLPRLSFRVEINIILDPTTLFELNSTFLRFDASFDESSIFLIVLETNLELPAQFLAFQQSSNYPGFVINPIFTQQFGNGKVRDMSFQPFKVTSMTLYTYLFYSTIILGCRNEVLQNLTSKCHRTSAILDIIAHRLNLTIKSQLVSPFNKNNFSSFVGPPKLEVCIGCGYIFQKRLSRKSPMLVRLYSTDVTHVYYCTDKSNFEVFRSDMFIEPIRPSLWLLMLVSYLTICLVNKNLHSGFALFATMLAQGINTRKWLRYPRLYVFISPILFVTFWYTSIVTTNIVAPIPSKVIQTFSEFFGLGYRIIGLNEVHRTQLIKTFNTGFGKRPKIILKPERVFVDPVLGGKLLLAPECNTLKQIAGLNVSGLVWGVDARQLIRTGSFGKYNSEGFACYIMPEPRPLVTNFSTWIKNGKYGPSAFIKF